jgi:hypothetical protein
MNNLVSYFERYALLSLEKQLKFAQLTGEYIAEMNLDAGLISFSEGIQFPFQVIGTESDNTLTWLWAWADEQTELPAELIKASLKMRSWGEKQGIPECTTPSVDLNRTNGHVLSMIASEICGADCYYHDAYEGGGVFLLLFGEAISRQPGFTADELSRHISFLLSLCDFNHRNAFLSYFKLRSLPATEHATFIVGELESGEDIRADFDSSGRLISINGMDIPA